MSRENQRVEGSDEARSGGETAPESLPTAAHISTLEALAIRRDLEGSLSFIESLLNQGISVEQVYLALIAPTARQLGHQAETEQRPFDEVASALDTIHKVIESLRLSPR